MVKAFVNKELSRDELENYSRETIEQGSKSFSRAAALMPVDVRTSVYLLYAWCRHCDDVIDNQNLGFACETDAGSLSIGSKVSALRQKTYAAYRYEADEAPFQALSCVVHQHRIPERFALDLIDGFAMDAAGETYTTEEDTLRYCYHVAGTVGVMMAMIMGVRDRSTLLRACDLGLAFQLTNISRDVIADAEAGRIYLPASWLNDAGLNAATFADMSKRKQLFDVVTRLLELADRYYVSAYYGLAKLPFRCSWSIASALRIYRAIGEEVRRAGPAAWDQRAGTGRLQKFLHVGLGLSDAVSESTLGKIRADTRRPNLWTPPAFRPDEESNGFGHSGFIQGSAQVQ